MPTPTPNLKFNFPKKFFWGAATAAHQVEGGTHNQWSIWELENSVARAQQSKYQLKDLPIWDEIKDEATNPKNYISGSACDHYNLYEQDFDLLTQLNMNAFRFSIEWSRIEPEEGKWDNHAIEHYRLYLHALERRGIEPFVTLWHWTMPEWFTAKGGFEKRSNISYFTRFVQKICHELGAHFRHLITLNEPEVYMYRSYVYADWPPMLDSKWRGLRVYGNLIRAHKQAYRVAKNINRKFIVGASLNISYAYAGDDAWLSKITAALAREVGHFFTGRIKKQLDFIGLNYYFTGRYLGSREHNPNEKLSDLGWDMQPQNIEFVLEDLHKRFKLPIIITENGLADRGDHSRKWWLGETIMAMQRALDKGVRLEGYLHWSLLDNFEWAYGFWPRFGLVAVDYPTKRRTIRPSAKWFGQIIKKLR